MNGTTPRQYAERHAKAFRTAFDFLNRHFPPDMSDQYWETALKDMKDVYKRTEDNPLAAEMLIVIWEYLDREAGNMKGVNEQ